MSEQRIQLAEEFVAAVVEELRAAYANPEFGGGPPEILAPAIRARDTAMIEAACAAVCQGCALNVPTMIENDDQLWHSFRATLNYSSDNYCFAVPIRTALAYLITEPGK